MPGDVPRVLPGYPRLAPTVVNPGSVGLARDYGLGVVTNLLLALLGSSLPWLVVAILFSGIYIAAEETLEKAAAAEFLPRELRSLGFGILASVNAVGDMVSSLYVGGFLEVNRPRFAFGIAAVAGAAGVFWLTRIVRQGRSVRGTLV